MGNIRSKKREIAVMGVPDDMPPEEKKLLLDLVERNMGQGWQGDYLEAQLLIKQSEQAFVDRSMRGFGPEQDTSKGSVTTEADALLPEQQEAKVTAKGVVDAFTREALPKAIAALSLPLTLANELTDLLSPMATDFVNEKFGWHQRSWPETKEAFFDRLGLERADTEAEMIAGTAGEGVGSVMGSVGAGMALRGAEGLAPTVGKAVGEQLAYKPITQMAGAAAAAPGAALGGKAGEAIVEKAGAGEQGQAIGNVAGQFLGGGLADLAISGAMAPLERRVRGAVTPMSTERAKLLQAGEQYAGETPVTRSEVMRIGETTQREMTGAQRRATRPGGSGEYLYQRFHGNKRLVAEEMGSYGIDVSELGATQQFAEDVMSDFLDTRKTKLDKYVTQKRDVIDRLTGDAPVPISKTDQYLDDLIQKNVDLGTKASNQRANFWKQLQAEIHDKNLDQLETIRKDYSHEIKAQDMPTEMQQELKKVYRELVGGYDPSTETYVDGDIGTFIKESGSSADYNQWSQANSELSKMAREFDDKALFGLLEEGQKNPENIQWEDILDRLTNVKSSQTQKVFDQLSDKGKNLAEVAIMAKIFQDANPTDLSPSQFAQSVQKYANNLQIVMSEKDFDRLAGMKRFLQNTAYSEDFARSGVGTHAPSVNVAPGAGPMASHVTRTIGAPALGISAAGVGILGKLAKHNDSPQVRNLIAGMAEVKPGTAAEAELVKRILRVIEAAPETRTGEQQERILQPDPLLTKQGRQEAMRGLRGR